MARKVFFSFDYDDIWRVNVVRKHYVTKGGYLVSGYIDKADFEEIKRQGEYAIRRWIDEQIAGTSVTVVLIGEKTYQSRWVKYEIEKSIERGNGLVGIYIHNIKDNNGNKANKGFNPFSNHFSERLKGREPKIYDWVLDSGFNNFPSWAENAAKSAGK
ncbi:TIR-like domain-containing protein [Bacteroidetes/Chlorobi group bacterium Naka2016]|jgi:hypothetical protein|nr:MAG: TIR-like domain-containing protein [Bacteroidetes/Chlorobi group bacterium Naka2016]